MKSFCKPLVLCFFGCFVMYGCKKTTPAAPSSTLTLDLHAYYGNNEIYNAENYTDIGQPNYNISFTLIKYYMCNFKLTTTSGSVVTVDSIVLFENNTQGIYTYPVGNIPVGIYKSISFDVGLLPAVNHSNPAQYGAVSNPLNINSYLMHYEASNSTEADSLGYKFMDIEGNFSLGGSAGVKYTHYIGGDALLETVNMPDHSAAPWNSTYNATTTSGITFHLIADFAQFYGSTNIDSTVGSLVLEDTLASRIPNMFRYLQ